jgi:hypothetical protein
VGSGEGNFSFHCVPLGRRCQLEERQPNPAFALSELSKFSPVSVPNFIVIKRNLSFFQLVNDLQDDGGGHLDLD